MVISLYPHDAITFGIAGCQSIQFILDLCAVIVKNGIVSFLISQILTVPFLCDDANKLSLNGDTLTEHAGDNLLNVLPPVNIPFSHTPTSRVSHK